MGLSLRHVLVFVIIGALWNLKGSEGIRFVIDRDDCFSHDVKYEGDTVHVSFVVIKADSSWHYRNEGVDLVVTSVNVFFIRNSHLFYIHFGLWKAKR